MCILSCYNKKLNNGSNTLLYPFSELLILKVYSYSHHVKSLHINITNSVSVVILGHLK